MESKKSLQKQNRDDDAYCEIRKFFQDICRQILVEKSHSIVFGKCEILTGLWAAYIEVFIFIQIAGSYKIL